MNRSSDKLSRWAGMLCFAGVVAKSVLEAVSGNVIFSSWHLGSLGTPIAACHAGGILGALCLWLFLDLKAKSRTTKSRAIERWSAAVSQTSRSILNDIGAFGN